MREIVFTRRFERDFRRLKRKLSRQALDYETLEPDMNASRIVQGAEKAVATGAGRRTVWSRTSIAPRIGTPNKRETRKSSAGSLRSMPAPLSSLIVTNSAAARGSA